MSDRPQPDLLSTEFQRERSIRSTVKLLEGKRQRIREELEQLIAHITLLVPSLAKSTNSSTDRAKVLQDAVKRLDDEAFAQLFLAILQKVQ